MKTTIILTDLRNQHRPVDDNNSNQRTKGKINNNEKKTYLVTLSDEKIVNDKNTGFSFHLPLL
jgi:hypothetical protein